MNLSNATCPHCCRLAFLATTALFWPGPPDALSADDSLARSVPADVGLFAEVRGAEDLLTALTDPQVWTTLAELVGQPAQPQDAATWRQRIRRTVKMEPEEAIRVLFARGVAFIGEGLGLSQDAVVLCRPAMDVSAKELLKRWNARRLPQPPRPPTYRLYGNIGVAERDGLLFFGDLLQPNGMFTRMQRLAAEKRPGSLADDPVYKQLLARVPQRPDGLLFARLTQAASIPVPSVPAGTQPTTQPDLRPALPELPGPLRNAENIMLALHREGPLLHFTAVGDAKGDEKPRGAGRVQLIDKLPERTLLAWEGGVVYSELAKVVERLPDENPIRGVFQLQEQVESLDQFLKALDADTGLAVGLVFPTARSPDAPPLPAAALLVGTRDPGVAGRELRNVVNAGMASYLLFAIGHGLPLLLPIAETTLGSTPAFVLDLSPLLKPTAKKAIGQVHLCWAVHDDVLIIASHLDWLRQIVAAREGRAPDLSKVVQLSRGELRPGSANAIVIQSGPIADIGTLWLEYLRRTKPGVFEERWWRSRQPGRGAVRLGITVIPDAANRRLRIIEVIENQPADGRLKVGDFIVGYGNKPFRTDDLISEMRTAIRERPHARWLDLLIERDGTRRPKRLPLPFINAVEILQRVSALGKIAQRAVYLDDHSDAAGPRGFLTVELRTSEKPLFEFARPVPVGSPDDTREGEPPVPGGRGSGRALP